MFRLTRQVRFALDESPDGGSLGVNSHAGSPAVRGFGLYLVLDVSVAGELDGKSGYLLNIKDIDLAVRTRGISVLRRALVGGGGRVGPTLMDELFGELSGAWPGRRLEALSLWLSPFLSISAKAGELPMTRVSQKFEFSASHRLHNPALSESANRAVFGKCNNPHGHGHNYEVQVTIAGRPGDDGLLIGVGELERIVMEGAIDRLDHRNLNVEVSEFGELIPSVENIARVIYGWLRPRFVGAGVRLASVTVWETPKTWCEYSEEV